MLDFLRNYASMNVRFYGATVVASIPAFRTLGLASALLLSFTLAMAASAYTWTEAQTLAQAHLYSLMPDGVLSVDTVSAYIENFPNAAFIALITLPLLMAWTYVTAALLFNRKIVVASRQALRVHLGPLPWSGSWEEPSSNLQGGAILRSETRTSHNRKTGRASTNTKTFVEVRLRSGETRVIHQEMRLVESLNRRPRPGAPTIVDDMFDLLMATGQANTLAVLVNHGLRGEALPPELKLPLSDRGLGDSPGERRFEWHDLVAAAVAVVMGAWLVQEFDPQPSGFTTHSSSEVEYAPSEPAFVPPIELIVLNAAPDAELPAGLMDALATLTPGLTVQQAVDAIYPLVSEFNPEGYLISNDWDVSDGSCFAYQEFGMLSLNKKGSLRVGFAGADFGFIGWMIFPYAHGPDLYHWDPLHQRFMGSFSGLREDAGTPRNEAIAAEAQAFYAEVHQDLRAGEEARVRRVTDPYSLKRMAEVPQLDQEFIEGIKQMAAAPETYEVVCEQKRYSTYEVRLVVRGDWRGSDGKLYPMMGRVVLNKLHNGSELSQEGEGEWTLRGLNWGPVRLL